MSAYYGGNGGGRTRLGTVVTVHVYDLSPINQYLYPLGLGLHHTGVELFGTEYTFADGVGIFHDTPKTVPNAIFRESIEIGIYDGTIQDIQGILSDLRTIYGFVGTKYHLLQKNCNHFANAFCWRLVNKTLPPHLNRLADFGACCSCLLPPSLLSSSPVSATTTPAGVKSSSSSSTSTQSVFSGLGNRLAPVSATMSSRSSTTAADDLTDRREKARKAALARLEQQQQNQPQQQ
jgi:deubiquitinase DESI2